MFSTFAPTQFLGDGDPELEFGGAAAHNRAMVDFCAERPAPAARGLRALGPAGRHGRRGGPGPRPGLRRRPVRVGAARDALSPTHPDYDGVWATLAERNVPFMLHVGGGGRPVPRAFHRNDRPVTDFLGGGENIRSKDYMGLFHGPEIFLSALVLDGVLERHPGLRGGCIEQGAMWVVPWLKRLDLARRTFGRTEPDLALPLAPSQYVHRQLWFTPFPTEPVGWLIEQAGDDLFLFSSDFPHPEGGRDPLARFAETTGDTSADALERFYSTNFADMMG